MAVAREKRLSAAGRDWGDIKDEQDIEETALIWSWRAGAISNARLELAKSIVRISTPVTLLSEAFQLLWVYIKIPWTLRWQVIDLTRREVGLKQQVNNLQEERDAARNNGIRYLMALLVESGAEIAMLEDKVKRLEIDLQTVNDGRATMLWREKAKENLELRRRTYEEILERDKKIKRLRDYRDDNAATSLGLDIRGQQTLRRLREELIRAEDKLAHSEMIIEKLKNSEAKIDEERERIKKDALYGKSARLEELYTNSAVQVEELSEKLKNYEYLADPEHDIEAVQRHCNEVKQRLQQEIDDKTQQISTYKAQIDHAMGSMNWADNKFDPLDKHFGFVSGAKAEIRRLSAALQRFEFSQLAPKKQVERLDILNDDVGRLSDQLEDFRVMRDDLQRANLQHETDLDRLRERLARRNRKITSLQTQNTELHVQLREARTVVPPAGALNVVGMATPLIEIFTRNLFTLEREIRRRDREVDEFPALLRIDDVPKIEREPGEIFLLRITELLLGRFHYLSTLTREGDPPLLGAADDWVDDDTDTPENLDARALARLLRLTEFWGYIGTLHYETIMYVRHFCRELGIAPGVELPETPRSPNLSPPPLPPDRRTDLFQARFTRYEDFNMKAWDVYELAPGDPTSAISATNAMLQSVRAQLPGHDASNIPLAEFTRNLVDVLGRDILFMIDPINERDVAEALYRVDHSFVLKTVVPRQRRDGITYTYHSREIVYPDELEVPPPRRIVVLYLSGDRWYGMNPKPERYELTESPEESPNGSVDDQSPPPNPGPVAFVMTNWKVDSYRPTWLIHGTVHDWRAGLSMICAVARSFHWQYPGVLFHNMNEAQAYEDLYQRCNRRHPHHDMDYSPLHIQAVLEDILGSPDGRPHYRLATISEQDINGAQVYYATILGDPESNSPILYIYNQGSLGLFGNNTPRFCAMRRRRENDSDEISGDLSWLRDVGPENEPPEELPEDKRPDLPPYPPPAVHLQRIENYGRNSVRAPFNKDPWKFFYEIDHFNEGLQRGNEDWMHDCAPRALYTSMADQMEIAHLTLEDIIQAFEDVFPNHRNAWQDEEVARVLYHPRLGGLTLGIVRGILYDDRTMIVHHWDQPENYDPTSGDILFVAQLTDQQPGGRPGNKYHWASMQYTAGGVFLNPVVDKVLPAPPRPSMPPRSRIGPLLDAATGLLRGPINDPATGGGSSGRANSKTAESFPSRHGQRREAPPPPADSTGTQQQGLNPDVAPFTSGAVGPGNKQQQQGYGSNTFTLEEQLRHAREMREMFGYQGAGDDDSKRTRGKERGTRRGKGRGKGEREREGEGVEKGRGRGKRGRDIERGGRGRGRAGGRRGGRGGGRGGRGRGNVRHLGRLDEKEEEEEL
ncbi:hypothetical protein DSL72_007104 [Monilinia vaccinii-corymbosi]|uniref:Uncharacterized protein n=1 Tax=Monilinia vaccinii-corymbosi TaxID=61207 RepID=A0A8A3PKS3_9HELO|nr:hypothetical protein DSL72_007104 [Monilinia vaccinii-corymbosi]